MDFKDQYGDEKVSVLLPQRSMLVMSGESRLKWTHGSVVIVHTTAASTSVTMVTAHMLFDSLLKLYVFHMTQCKYTHKCYIDSYYSCIVW